MEFILAKFSGALAGQLGALLGRKAKDALLGTADQRALDAACRAAMRRAVEESSLSREDLEHALGLLEHLVREHGSDKLPLLDTAEPPDAATLRRWRGVAIDIGQAPETFPVSFDVLVERLLRLIPEEISRTASAPDSPLFPKVAIARLEQLGANIAALSSTMGDGGLARFVPLADPLERDLAEALNNCEVAGRRFVTPNLLLAIVSAPLGQVATCLAAVRSGLAQEVLALLRRYVITVPVGEFVPFDWRERADVQRAQQLAWAANVPVVTHLFLFRGVLDVPSNTRNQLSEMLGQQDFVRLGDLARDRSHARGPQPPTPGPIFPAK
jgi:hypothetical protein